MTVTRHSSCECNLIRDFSNQSLRNGTTTLSSNWTSDRAMCLNTCIRTRRIHAHPYVTLRYHGYSSGRAYDNYPWSVQEVISAREAAVAWWVSLATNSRARNNRLSLEYQRIATGRININECGRCASRISIDSDEFSFIMLLSAHTFMSILRCIVNYCERDILKRYWLLLWV